MITTPGNGSARADMDISSNDRVRADIGARMCPIGVRIGRT